MEKYIVEPNTGCWLWLGSESPNGYGVASFRGSTTSAHRAIFIEMVGHIPDGMELDHLCRQKNCVNPAHMEPVTHKENMARAMAAKPFPDQCKNGHTLTGFRVRPGGGRYCKTCVRDSKRRQRERKLQREKRNLLLSQKEGSK